jgi:hypothetical protein
MLKADQDLSGALQVARLLFLIHVIGRELLITFPQGRPSVTSAFQRPPWARLNFQDFLSPEIIEHNQGRWHGLLSALYCIVQL